MINAPMTRFIAVFAAKRSDSNLVLHCGASIAKPSFKPAAAAITMAVNSNEPCPITNGQKVSP